MQGQASATRGPGPALHRYPFLVYAPRQWGPIVATEDKGCCVRTISQLIASGRTHADIVALYGTTLDHVRDALRYCEDHPA